MRKIFLIALLPLALTGCNEAVNTVKNARMQVNEQYTVDQAFSHRDICASVDWNVITDDRGRELVQYTCQIADIAPYYETAKKQQREHLLSVFDTDNRVAQVNLASTQQEVESAEQALNTPSPTGPELESEQLIQLKDLAEILSDDSLNRALELRNRYTLPIGQELIGLSRRYFDQQLWIKGNGSQSASPERLAAYQQAETDLRQAIHANYTAVQAALTEERNRLTAIQQGRQEQQSRFSQQRLQKARDAYERLQRSVESQLAELEVTHATRLKQFDNAATIKSVADRYQWVVKGRQIELVWSGLESTYTDGKVKTSKHPDPQGSLRDVYSNMPKTYTDMRDKASLMY